MGKDEVQNDIVQSDDEISNEDLERVAGGRMSANEASASGALKTKS